MHLSGDFDEAEGRIEVVADRVLSECFDFGVTQASGAEMIQGMLDERPS